MRIIPRKDTSYCYRRFTPEAYDFEIDDALKAGDTYVDIDLRHLDGTPAKLSSFLKFKPLVLETGSLTCPMYAQSAGPMQKIMEDHPEFNFVVLYVREAHPGERTPQHKSQAEKQRAASRLKSSHGEGRMVLVDDVEGTGHAPYGAMPNSVFVIGMDGTVLFRSLWNNTRQISEVLDAITKKEAVEAKEFKAIKPLSLRTLRTLLIGGFVAGWDLLVSLRRLMANHRKVRSM